MSKIGKKIIEIPEGVEVKINNETVTVKGPKGELSLRILPEVEIKAKDKKVIVLPRKQTRKTEAFWGLTRMLLFNQIKGVSEGFEKKLEIKGIGYKAVLEGNNKLRLEVGFSHPVIFDIPTGIEAKVEKNIITISGIDKQKVGEFAASIRRIRPPEPYKGKGIRYLGEVVRRKEGKRTVATS